MLIKSPNVTFCSPGINEDLITTLILLSSPSISHGSSPVILIRCFSTVVSGRPATQVQETAWIYTVPTRARARSLCRSNFRRTDHGGPEVGRVFNNSWIHLVIAGGKGRRTVLQIVYLVATPEGDRATGEITTWFRGKICFYLARPKIRVPGLESFGHTNDGTGTKSFPSKSETSEFSQDWGFLFFCSSSRCSFFLGEPPAGPGRKSLFSLPTATDEATLSITRTTY